MEAEYPAYVNLGDMFGVQTTRGQGATSLRDYMPFTWFPRGLDILNVRYIAVTGKQHEGRPVYEDGTWRVFENPTACPRAWVVHRAEFETSVEKIKEEIQKPGFDPRHSAFVAEPISPEQLGQEATSAVTINRYECTIMELTVQTGSAGLLVLSETYYPGWSAAVNGKSKHIYKVDGLLRGILLDPGENRVVLRYRPRSILLGAGLSVLAFVSPLAWAGVIILRKRSAPKQSASA